jgi:hypothetical protein
MIKQVNLFLKAKYAKDISPRSMSQILCTYIKIVSELS